MESFVSLSITCELHYSSSVVDSLLAAHDLVKFLTCLQLDTDRTNNCVLKFRLKPPWSYFLPTISTRELGSNVRIVSEPLQLTAITLQMNPDIIVGWYMFSARL